MLNAGRQTAPTTPARRGVVIALRLRHVVSLPPPRDPRVPIASTVLSVLAHGVVLLWCALQMVVSPVDPPPIKVTLLGTAPDAGGSGAPAAAPAVVAPPARPVPAVARPNPPTIKPAVVPPAPVKPAAIRRPAQVNKASAPPASAKHPASAPALAPAPPAESGTTGGSDVAGVGGGIGTGRGSGVGRGTRDGVQGDPSGSAVASYLERLRQRLEKVKRYPLLARRRGQVGTATLAIAIDRNGRPSSVRLQGSSGSELLDEEATDMVSRAAPFEPLPAEVSGDRIQITVPVRFDVNG
ncbi:MAG: energy transducer TonB [Deltaproteobacteria bacterium]|nr:energy transducer TonB [Deltaproteobacteria bacterium]